MGHHKSSSSKPATTQQNTTSTTTSFVQPATANLINQAIQGVAMPPDLQYVGLNQAEKDALAKLQNGRNYAVQNGVQGVMSSEYQRNIAAAKAAQATGNQMGQNAQNALNQVNPILNRSNQMIQNAQNYLQQQANATGGAKQFIDQASTAAGKAGSFLNESANAAGKATTWIEQGGAAAQLAGKWLEKQGQTLQQSGEELDQARKLQEEVASGQRSIADMTPQERADYINNFYNSDLVNQQRDVLREEMRNNIQAGVQNLNQQAMASGNMASSRAGIAQGVLTSKAMGEEQKNLAEFETNQYQLASQNATSSITERLNALSGMGTTANGMIAGAQARQAEAAGYGNVATGYNNQSNNLLNVAQGYNQQSANYQGIATGFNNQSSTYSNMANNQLAMANSYGNVAQGYNQGANTLINLAGSFGQLGSQYANLQGNYYAQGNSYETAGTNQANQLFMNAQSIQDAQVKDAANRFAAGQINQQNAQAQANVNYQNTLLHSNPALSKLQTLLPMLNTVSGWQTTTTNVGTTSATAAQQAKPNQTGALIGGILGAVGGSYLGSTNAAGSIGMTSQQGQQLGTGAGAYLGSMFS